MSYKVLIFDVTPQQKQRPRFARKGKKAWTYTPKETKEFEAKIAKLAKEQLGEHWKPLDCGVNLHIRLYFEVPKSWSKEKRKQALEGKIKPNKKLGDIDNHAKSVLDGLNGVLYEDDYQVYNLEVTKEYKEEAGIALHIFYEDETENKIVEALAENEPKKEEVSKNEK